MPSEVKGKPLPHGSVSHPECHDCRHMTHERITYGFEFEVRAPKGFLPTEGVLLDALRDALPREWWTPETGADWWLQHISEV